MSSVTPANIIESQSQDNTNSPNNEASVDSRLGDRHHSLLQMFTDRKRRAPDGRNNTTRLVEFGLAVGGYKCSRTAKVQGSMNTRVSRQAYNYVSSGRQSVEPKRLTLSCDCTDVWFTCKWRVLFLVAI